MPSTKIDEKDEKSSLNGIFSHFTFFSAIHLLHRYRAFEYNLRTAAFSLRLHGVMKKLQSRYCHTQEQTKPTKSVHSTDGESSRRKSCRINVAVFYPSSRSYQMTERDSWRKLPFFIDNLPIVVAFINQKGGKRQSHIINSDKLWTCFFSNGNNKNIILQFFEYSNQPKCSFWLCLILHQSILRFLREKNFIKIPIDCKTANNLESLSLVELNKLFFLI